MAPLPASSEPSVDFLAVDGQVHLVGTDESELLSACGQLREYSAYIRARNGLAPPTRCPAPKLLDPSIQKAFREEKAQLSLVPRVVRSHLRDQFLKGLTGSEGQVKLVRYGIGPSLFDMMSSELDLRVLNIGGILPEALWKPSIEKKPTDVICYNMATIASGILSFRHISRFIDNIDYYLGMADIAIKQVENGLIKVSMARKGLADLFVLYRQQWAVHVANKEPQFIEISKQLRQNFSPGSVMCMSEVGLKSASALLAGFDKGSLPVDVQDPPKSLAHETKGDHCFNFMTPDLIVDANVGAPHRLMRWRDLYESFHFDSPEGIALYYFQINQTATLKAAADMTSKAHALDGLLPFLEEHKKLYEDLASKGHDSQCSRLVVFPEIADYYGAGSCKAKKALRNLLKGFKYDPYGFLKQSRYGEGSLLALQLLAEDPLFAVISNIREAQLERQ